MEQVLMWPEQYPLLLKGLIENNGAFILDALEAWPECNVVLDDRGVKTTTLPPLDYLLWVRPLEPFEFCHYQHIDDFTEQEREYVNQAYQFLIEEGEREEVHLQLELISRLGQYSSIQAQLEMGEEHCFIDLALNKRTYGILKFLIEKEICFPADGLVKLWCEGDEPIRHTILEHLDSVLSNKQDAVALTIDALMSGENCAELLSHLCSEDDIQEHLETALLHQVAQAQARQAKVINLVKQGARGNLTDEEGRSALSLVVEKGFVSAAEGLLENYKPNTLDQFGRNLMHYAVISNSPAMLEKLFEVGEDPFLQDNNGTTPYKIAMQTRSLISKKTLEKHGVVELSPAAKFSKVKNLHLIYSLIAVFLPAQLFLFFNENNDYKAVLTMVMTLLGVMMMFYTRSVKKDPLYPTNYANWSLKGVNALAWLSIGFQIFFTVVVATTLFTLY